MDATTNTFNLFVVLLTAAVTFYNYPDIDPNLQSTDLPSNKLEDEYDFIIVGAGSAGNVVANRLTEVGNWTVLLLEVGSHETAVTDTPMLSFNLRASYMDWNYTTVPQKNACQATNGICTWPRGRILGGSSVVNDFVYIRGLREDFDNWAELGNPGWSYKEVLPYFLKSEDNQDPTAINSPYHRQGGYLTVNRSPFLTPVANVNIQAGEELGYPYGDLNGAAQLGIMIMQGTIRNGSRCSTAKGFLRPARNRPNLNVAEESFVTKININPETKTATGVTFVRNGSTIIINARKEVILSAGAVNSPQLLMVSGVGPQEHLEELGIPIVQNLRVGDNLYDHVGVPFLFTTKENVTLNWRSTYENFSAIIDYAMNARGPLTSMNAAEGIIFIDSNSSHSPKHPDGDVAISAYWPYNQDGQLISVLVYMQRPKSTGTIRLSSSNITEKPLIDPQYYLMPSDAKTTLQIFKFPFRLAQTKAYQQLGAEFYYSAYPQCSGYNDISEDFLLCILEQYSVTIYHPVGTCKMGPSSDSTAVVDSRLRVYGIKGLRVIDASIMPQIVSGNTNAPTIMIGERASDFIKEDYGQPTM